MKLRIAGIGALGPGFEDWPGLRALLDGAPPPAESGPVRPAPEGIPPRERRRAPLSVKLAVAVAEQACADAGIAPADTVSVFASGMGDMDITDYMCRTLAEDEPLLSPTKFHNSVHNAPVGYWTISQDARLSSNAVAGFTHTVPTSLLEAATQCLAEQVPVLWASQDIAAPAPFRDIADIDAPCAFALLLLPHGEDDIEVGHEAGGRVLELSVEPGAGEWPAFDLPALVTLYDGNPTARLLPLLRAITQADAAPLRLPLGASLDLVVQAA